MSKRVLIITMAAVLFATLALYDRAHRTKTVLAATLLSLTEVQETEGAGQWVIRAKIDDTPITLEPLHARPDLGPGDSFCITQSSRIGKKDVYFRAPSDAC